MGNTSLQQARKAKSSQEAERRHEGDVTSKVSGTGKSTHLHLQAEAMDWPIALASHGELPIQDKKLVPGSPQVAV